MLALIKSKLRGLKFHGKRILARNMGKHYCPCCKSRVLSFNNWKHVKGEICPYCGSARRHRLLHLFLTENTTSLLTEPKRLLHIAPEKTLYELFKTNNALEYVSADISMDNVSLKMDITNIPFPDDSFDFVVCNHVLEHVIDDIRAMSEFCRILKPDGLSILQIPNYPEKTIEDASVVDPEERLRLFGLEDHVRKYGPDYKHRLQKAGFIVKDFLVNETYTNYEVDHFGLDGEEIIYNSFKTQKGFKNIKSLS